MRSIGTIPDENLAARFSNYLHHRGIENTVEGHQIWIHNEDQISDAAAALQRFLANANDAAFDAPLPAPAMIPEEPIEPQAEEQPRQFRAPFTLLVMFLCAFIFGLQTVQEYSLMEDEGLSEATFLMTPIQAALLYDLPPELQTLETTIETHNVAPTHKLTDIPTEVKEEIQLIQKTPFWKGIYSWILLKWTGQDPDLALGPLFYKIRQGEIWRLFSPALLHAGFLHILFNMIWLWVLGRHIEQRIGIGKTLVLTLSAGILSNTAQYLVSGPLFLGYSGVITGLAGFIWSREKVAPWEGYPVRRSLLVFLALFVIAMTGLSLFSFLMQGIFSLTFFPEIANTAHIAGTVVGLVFGRMQFFSSQRIQ